MLQPAAAPLRLGTVATAVDFLSQVGPTSRALAEAEPDQHPALLDGLRTALAAHADPDGELRLSGAVWLVTARANADP